MARTILEFTYNRNRGVKMTPLDTSFLTGDKNGHEFRIKVIDDQGNVDLSGESVSGWMIPDDQGRTDDQSVPLTGTTDGNVAVLTLSEECYKKVGRFSLVIKAGKGEELSAIFWATGSMLRTHTDVIVQSDTIKDLDALLAQIAAMEAATADARAATDEVRTVLSDEGNEQVAAIRTAGEEQVAAVNTAGENRTTEVNAAGASQIAEIENKGANTLATIPADYTQIAADVSSLKDTRHTLYYADAVTIPDGTDFNTLTTPGNYRVNTVASIKTMLNAPTSTNGGRLTVESLQNKDRVVQRYTEVQSSNKRPVHHERSTANGGTTWGEWHEIITSLDIDYIAEEGDAWEG